MLCSARLVYLLIGLVLPVASIRTLRVGKVNSVSHEADHDEPPEGVLITDFGDSKYQITKRFTRVYEHEGNVPTKNQKEESKPMSIDTPPSKPMSIDTPPVKKMTNSSPFELEESPQTTAPKADYGKSRMTRSQIWAQVADKEVSLKKLRVRVKDRWRRYKKQLEDIQRDWSEVKTKIRARRAASHAKTKDLVAMSALVKAQRNEIRKLKRKAYTLPLKTRIAEGKFMFFGGTPSTSSAARAMSKSQIWAQVEVKEAALEELRADIKSQWHELNKNKSDIDRSWSAVKAKVAARRVASRAFKEELYAMAARVKARRKEISELKRISYKY